MSDPNTMRYRYIFEELLRMTDDGFIVIDPQGIVTDINEQYCEFLGKPKAAIIGLPITHCISNSKMLDIVANKYSEELSLHKYVSGDTKESDNNFVLVSRSCVFDDRGEVAAGIAQVRFRLQALDSAKRLMREYSELEFYREEYQSREGCKPSFDCIVGSSNTFASLKRAGHKAARTDFSVLLTGETGTGKEVFARAIHAASNRAEKPMVSINCAAIPTELLESELFGYADGAFTGARRGGKQGKFQLAGGGTLFLDEIGDMPLNMQAKILRALQEKEIEPVGAVAPVPVDVRIISATRKDLTRMIETGEFREDLYYRLNVINLEMVPLRERREDILELALYFLRRLNQEYGRGTLFSNEVRQCFVRYAWPGNIRELDNVIKGAYASCDGLSIDMNDLSAKVAGAGKPGRPAHGRSLPEVMDDYEREVIKSALKDTSGNCQAAAQLLGIHRSALYKKMEKLSIHPHRDVLFE